LVILLYSTKGNTAPLKANNLNNSASMCYKIISQIPREPDLAV